MLEIPVNYWAVIVAAVAKQALGVAWFSPPLFGKQFCDLSGVGEARMKADLPKVLPFDFIASLVMAWVLAHFTIGASVIGGVKIGVFLWLGFVLVATWPAVLYEKRPLRLWAIGVGYQLVALGLMGAILAAWR